MPVKLKASPDSFTIKLLEYRDWERVVSSGFNENGLRLEVMMLTGKTTEMERYIIIVVNVINTPLENDIIWKEA
jgi:hypothetical protein